MARLLGWMVLHNFFFRGTRSIMNGILSSTYGQGVGLSQRNKGAHRGWGDVPLCAIGRSANDRPEDARQLMLDVALRVGATRRFGHSKNILLVKSWRDPPPPPFLSEKGMSSSRAYIYSPYAESQPTSVLPRILLMFLRCRIVTCFSFYDMVVLSHFPSSKGKSTSYSSITRALELDNYFIPHGINELLVTPRLSRSMTIVR
ncbi:hypothetical protein Lal_00031551 [Lupinus albus]|nr:hypothetical protein Lal_00031551 [Lupinus albus]